MRGRRKAVGLLIFTLAAVAAAASTHALVAAPLRSSPRGAVRVAAGAVALGAVAEALLWRYGWPRPVAVLRQVPQPWGHVRPVEVVALRYGARLGVGPATILTSWAWWGALLLGATLGPLRSAFVGAAFALTRSATNAAAGAGVSDGTAMSRRFRSIEAWAKSVRSAGTVVTVTAAVTGAAAVWAAFA